MVLPFIVKGLNVTLLKHYNMAYNRKNYFMKVIRIQEITLAHTSKGCTQEWIYYNLISPQFNISKSTYYTHLRCNAKAELKKLNAATGSVKIEHELPFRF